MTKKLNLKQETFCKLYTQSTEFFGNGVQSYIKAYDPDISKSNWYNSARTCAQRLLTNVDILKYIDKLLEASGLNDQFVDKQIKFLITQNADFTAKLGAIREYNKLKARIKDKIELTGKDGTPLVQTYILPNGVKIEFK